MLCRHQKKVINSKQFTTPALNGLQKLGVPRNEVRSAPSPSTALPKQTAFDDYNVAARGIYGACAKIAGIKTFVVYIGHNIIIMIVPIYYTIV